MKARNRIKTICMLAVVVGIMINCSTGRVKFRRAEALQREANYIKAVDYYMQAVKLRPNEARYRLKLMEALLEASNYYYRQAMKHKEENNLQSALLEIDKSLEYNPSNNLARLEKKALLKAMSDEGGEKQEEKTWIEQMKDKTSLSSTVLAKAEEEEISIGFKNKIELEKIFKTLAEISGINIIFDPGFRNDTLAISLDKVTLSQALERICLLKGLFYKILDKNTIIIVPDTAARRKIYDEQIIKNYYLSNIKAADCVKVISRITMIKNITADENHNTITVREIPEKVALVERLIKLYDKRKPEVLVMVDIMEVNKDKLAEYGTEFSRYQVGQSLITSGEEAGIRGNRFYYLNSSDFSFTIPTIIYKLLETDSDSKVIARPQVRGEDGEKINIKLGDRVPFPRTSFVPYNTGGPEQQPITSYDLQDVGIEIVITPQVHHDGEISLELDFKLTFITSPGTSTLPPTIGNRSVKTRIRLKDGETGIMAGLLRDSERRSKKGIPGINKLPILGSIFSSNLKQVNQTDIILRVTPYIVRMPDIDETDLSPIESGTESNIKLKK